jgi:hypothetical protein
LNGSDALLVVTEWKGFKSPDFDQVRSRLKQPVIFDGRNLYDPDFVRSLVIEYGVSAEVLAVRSSGMKPQMAQLQPPGARCVLPLNRCRSYVRVVRVETSACSHASRIVPRIRVGT